MLCGKKKAPCSKVMHPPVRVVRRHVHRDASHRCDLPLHSGTETTLPVFSPGTAWNMRRKYIEAKMCVSCR